MAEELEDKTTVTVSSFNLILLCTKLSIMIFDLMIKKCTLSMFYIYKFIMLLY